MESRFIGKITEKQYELIDSRCEKENVETSQFLDWLIGYSSGNIDKMIKDFINYNTADGWYLYHRGDLSQCK